MAARLGLLILLLAAAVWVGQAGQVPERLMNFRAGSAHFQGNPQTNTTLSPQSNDLSGTYVGILNYPTAGLAAVAMLTIDGNKFTLNIESKTLSGRINPVTAGNYTRVMLVFEPPLDGAVSLGPLSASKDGNRLRLASLPGEDAYFRFGDQSYYAARRKMGDVSGRMGEASRASQMAGRNPASVDKHSGNSANTNSNISVANNDSKVAPKDSNSSGRKIGRKVPPTGAANSNVGSMPNSDGNSNVNSNRDSDTSVRSQLRGNANIAFSTPESMQFTEIRDIELRVSPSESSEALARTLGEPGKSGTGSTEFADRMEAQLVGTGFTITSACPEIQPVETGRTTWWKWQIKPKEAGPQRLDLTLNAVLNNGKDKSMVQTFHRDIRIDVTWRQRASSIINGLKDMQWLWAAIILPIGAAIFGWWRKRKSLEVGEV